VAVLPIHRVQATLNAEQPRPAIRIIHRDDHQSAAQGKGVSGHQGEQRA